MRPGYWKEDLQSVCTFLRSRSSLTLWSWKGLATATSSRDRPAACKTEKTADSSGTGEFAAFFPGHPVPALLFCTCKRLSYITAHSMCRAEEGCRPNGRRRKAQTANKLHMTTNHTGKKCALKKRLQPSSVQVHPPCPQTVTGDFRLVPTRVFFKFSCRFSQNWCDISLDLGCSNGMYR